MVRWTCRHPAAGGTIVRRVEHILGNGVIQASAQISDRGNVLNGYNLVGMQAGRCRIVKKHPRHDLRILARRLIG